MSNKVVSVISSAMILVGAGWVAGLFALSNTYRTAALEVCDLIDENYYRRSDPEVAAFIAWCRREADAQGFLLSKEDNVERLNGRLAALRTSHLSLYNPAQNRQIWEHQGLDTGMRARFIDRFLVVYRVLPKSPAEEIGVRPGDVLVGLAGYELQSAERARTGSGVLQWQRKVPIPVAERNGGEDHRIVTFEKELRAVDLREDMSPRLSRVGPAYLFRIPSFLGSYFEGDQWRKTIAQLAEAAKDPKAKLIIDLRENQGGSFPGMLRALSPFRCDRPLIGRIRRSMREGMLAETDLADDLDAGQQLRQLHSASVVNLRAFKTSVCFRGPATVLIDDGTASVAEIFAEAFLSRPQSRVWGHPSAGAVVMAQWFYASGFGGHFENRYSISIPIASYLSESGADLEHKGIQPQKLLHYDLDSALAGRDNWIDDGVSN
jgi:C-terminal processing protease CtpA/Prc